MVASAFTKTVVDAAAHVGRRLGWSARVHVVDLRYRVDDYTDRALVPPHS